MVPEHGLLHRDQVLLINTGAVQLPGGLVQFLLVGLHALSAEVNSPVLHHGLGLRDPEFGMDHHLLHALRLISGEGLVQVLHRGVSLP